MNVSVLDWSDAFLNDAARELAERVVREYEENPYSYVDEDEINLREEETFDRIAEELAEESGIEDQQRFCEELWTRFDHSVFDEAMVTVKDTIEDHMAFRADPLGYYGLSQRDFF